MKNSLLALSTLIVLQMSTCGNQSIDSWSKYDRAPSIIDDLYKEYLDDHETLEKLDEDVNDVLAAKSKTIDDWSRYNSFSHAYWQEARSFVSDLDTSVRQDLLAYFDQQEKKYAASTKSFKTETANIHIATEELLKNRSLMKLMASQHQMDVYLQKNKPDLKALQDHKSVLDKTNKKVQEASQNLAKGKLNLEG